MFFLATRINFDTKIAILIFDPPKVEGVNANRSDKAQCLLLLLLYLFLLVHPLYLP